MSEIGPPNIFKDDHDSESKHANIKYWCELFMEENYRVREAVIDKLIEMKSKKLLDMRILDNFAYWYDERSTVLLKHIIKIHENEEADRILLGDPK